MTALGARIPAIVNVNGARAAEAVAALTATGAFDVVSVAPRDVQAAVQQCLASGATRVLVAGGDGTICAAANALVGSTVELAILPAGTLNHFAKDLGIPEDLAEAARVAARDVEDVHGDDPGAATRCIDVGRVNGRVFLNTSSVGAYVRFVRVRERWRPRVGYWIASAIAGVRILMHLPMFRVALEVDGVTREYETPLVFVGVGERELRLPTLGARVADGRRGLHVMVVRSSTGARLLALGLAAAARGIRAVSRTPAMDSFLVERCRIVSRGGHRPEAISVDGEVIVAEAMLEYEIVRGGLRVVMGRDLCEG